MPGWLTLIPPIIVLVCSYITKKIVPSLLLGITSAAIIASEFSIKKTITIIWHNIDRQLDISNIYIFIFLFALGAIICLITASGGTNAYSNFIKSRTNSPKGAETASAFLSLLSSFDDYFSCITTGSVMRPLTDAFSIPRVKLAFLIDALAAPLVILVPFSSWIAMLTMQVEESGISTDMTQNPLIVADPFWAYLRIIPFISYSFIIIISVLFIIWYRISFGTMKKHEQIAVQQKNLFGGKSPIATPGNTNTKGSLADFLVPLITLFVAVLGLALYSGNYYLLGSINSLFKTFQETDIFFALCFGSIITLIISIFYYQTNRKISTKTILLETYRGITMMLPTVTILLLAWIFSSLLRYDLESGVYLASLIKGIIIPALLPAIFFLASAVTSIAIGSSWGTIATFVPLATPMMVQLSGLAIPISLDQIPQLLPLLGAIFAGAIAGDHISPISSTTLMSSNSAGAYHVDHVKSQFEYACPALIGSLISCIIAGLLIPYGVVIAAFGSLIAGIICNIIMLGMLNKHSI